MASQPARSDQMSRLARARLHQYILRARNVSIYITICVLFVSMVEVVSARVDEETRRKMRRLRHVNWSEVVREAIQEKIRLEDRRRVRDTADVEVAIRIMDSIRRPREGFDGVEEIRKWRDLRR